jgi:hypothetical protein
MDVSFAVMGTTSKAIGSTTMPLILINAATQRRFMIKLHALVMPDLLMGMFIGSDVKWLKSQRFGGGTGEFEFQFEENGERIRVKSV